MFDINQILITTSIAVITVTITIIAIHLVLVLRDVKRLLRRVNGFVDDLENIGVNIGHGYSEIIGFIAGFKKLLMVVDLINRKRRKKNDK